MSLNKETNAYIITAFFHSMYDFELILKNCDDNNTAFIYLFTNTFFTILEKLLQ